MNSEIQSKDGWGTAWPICRGTNPIFTWMGKKNHWKPSKRGRPRARIEPELPESTARRLTTLPPLSVERNSCHSSIVEIQPDGGGQTFSELHFRGAPWKVSCNHLNTGPMFNEPFKKAQAPKKTLKARPGRGRAGSGRGSASHFKGKDHFQASWFSHSGCNNALSQSRHEGV